MRDLTGIRKEEAEALIKHVDKLFKDVQELPKRTLREDIEAARRELASYDKA